MPVWSFRTLEEWLASGGTAVVRDFDLPVAFKGFTVVFRDFDLPVAAKGSGLIVRDFDLPFAWSSGFSVRGVHTPLSLATATFSRRDVRTPLTLLGNAPFLLLQWNDLAKLSAALPLFWNDQNAGLNAQIVLNWSVLDTLIALPLVWRVIPNVQPLFSADVQKPTATVVETP